MIQEARTQLQKLPDEVDKDPLAINIRSGILRFRPDERRAYQAVLTPHDRDALMTKIAEVGYQPGNPSRCPRFTAFLKRIQPDPDNRRFLQQWFGYCLTGLVTEQKLAFFYGQGRNGKSTLIEVISRILGTYESTLPIESLTGTEQRKGSDATPDLVRLPGVRLVRASEPERGQRLREGLIKSFTGG